MFNKMWQCQFSWRCCRYAVICARYILIYSLIKKVAPADRPAALFVPSSWADGILINFINISYLHLSEGAYQENINFKLRS